MQRRVLGRTGLQVSQLGYGAMELRGPRFWGGRPVTEGEAARLLNAVLDAGINFLDTAYDYGMSEELIGRAIGHRRREYYLATKCGCTVVSGPERADTPHVWSRDTLLENIDASLRRLRTEYIDVWQLHNPTVEQVERGRLVEVMEEVRAAGKVRWIGISTTLPELDTFLAWGVFDAFQIPYSALEPEHEQAITAVARAGSGTVIRGGVARGAPAEGGLGEHRRWAIWERAKLDELRAPGESRTAFLLRLTLSHPDVHTVIVGTLNPAHLADDVRAAEAGPLPADLYAEAQRRLAAART
jgi:aryl-alcohol dehydrogenase-like predicted oxidoreductase